MIGLFFWMCYAMVPVFGLSLQMETISDIIRDPSGDFFIIKSDDCQTKGCAKNGRFAQIVKTSTNECKCQCDSSHPVIKEDINECIDQLDCSLVNFMRPFLTEHIPVVSLPVSSGQLVHPGAHLILSGDDKSINYSKQLLCQIEGSDIMTPKGWKPIRMNGGSHAFDLYENGNHTFLQWLANDSVRKSLHQKLVLIRLFCSPFDSSTDLPTFKPCIAIRVGWVPGLNVVNTKESSDQNKAFNTQNTSYSMIGLCLGLLGVMYVSALMIYMRSKRSEDFKYDGNRQMTHRWPSNLEENRNNNNSMINTSNMSPNDFRPEMRVSSPDYDSLNIDIESDIRSTTTDSKQPQTSIEKSTSGENLFENINENENHSNESSDSQMCVTQSPIYEKRLQKPDRIPRHCLRISPELFEPQLLLDPPPTAVEMLQKIRDLISIAKTRLKNFRFRPTLVVIPEDDYFYNENRSVDDMDSEVAIIFGNEDTISVDTNDEILDINDENHSIICIDNETDTQMKSFSRKQILNNLQTLSNTENINNLNSNEKTNITDKVIVVQNIDQKSEELESNQIYSDIQSLEVMSVSAKKVDLFKTFEKQIFNERQVTEPPEKRVFSYLRNSLGRFGPKPKPKSDHTLVSSNNWTLQSASTVKKTRSRNMNQKSVIRKRMTSRRGQLCYNCSDVSSFYSHRLNHTFNDLENKTSLESNENNESMDSFDFCSSEMYSDSEMSTTSSTIRDNQLTSLESELNDNPSHLHITVNQNEEHNSIDECLKYLAAASVDDNHDKYYQRIGRTSKTMTSIKNLKFSDWNHVCHRSDSELEISGNKLESKSNFYSKNSKSRIKSSKSLNSSYRQKFKKKLALYKSQTNQVLKTRTDSENSSQVFRQMSLNPFCGENEQKDNLSAQYVIKIKI